MGQRVTHCPKCGALKELRRGDNFRCRACQNARRRQRMADNLALSVWRSASARAGREGIEFTIRREDVVVPEVCPLLGIPILKGKGRISRNSPSLDRIDNARGYVPGNVWVISAKANSMKQDASWRELLQLAQRLRERVEGGVVS